MSIRSVTPVLLLAAAVAIAGSLGCSKSLKATKLLNQTPTVRLTYAPVDTTKEEFYVYKMQWVGYDPDGRVVSFQYAIDPPSRSSGADTAWITTTRNEQIVSFTATKPESLGPRQQPRSQGFHVFVLRAVDNDHAVSPYVARAFFSFGVAPTIQVLTPQPRSLLSPSVTPAVRIRWEGKDFIDPNGFVFEKPVQYKFRLYKNAPNIPWSKWITYPDSMRADVAPEFAGWDSCGPEETEHQYTNLVPSNEYLFVIVAFGRSGAYSPIFSLDSNMLRMFVGFAGELGPKITLFNSFFVYTYPSGGFPSPLPPSWAVQLQVPSDEKLTFNWTAEAPQGSVIRWYRWALDIENLDDETPRRNSNDLIHWSSWAAEPTNCVLGPFAGAGGDTGEVHNWYVEAQDINGLTSLGWVQFRVFKPSFAKEMLVIDDTGTRADYYLPGRTDTMQAPTGNWPSRAELDTFLFAVGGVRYKMMPTGTLSRPGLFHGYSFDTLGTRRGLEDPTLSLNLLGSYRHVVWMTDKARTDWPDQPVSRRQPKSTLRFMCMPNKQNTLATYVNQGGKLFACGGGFGHATNMDWNKANDGPFSVRVYASDGSDATKDLVPGRFMFDLAHWRSEFRVYSNASQMRFGRYDRPDPYPTNPDTNVQKRRWKGRPWMNANGLGPAGAALYSALPREISYRDPSTDPLWPGRTNRGEYYLANPLYSGYGWDVEYLVRTWQGQVDNEIEELDSTFASRVVLDTLYMLFGTNNQICSPGYGWNTLMTHYHGWENGQVTFLGAPLWGFRRTDCQGIVDCVLQTIWGLSKNVPAVAAPPAMVTRPAGVTRVGAQPVRSPVRGAVQRPTATSIQRLR